jgi:hypothetical protein
VEPRVVAAPGDGTVGLQVNVLNARRRVGHLVHGVGRRKAVRDVADFAVDVDIDVAFLGAALIM